MAVLTDLPLELLEHIFCLLGSIDDVHNFGRTCRKTARIIQNQFVYVEVMRSIIVHSPQHRYDLQLCKMLELHRKIVTHFRQGGSRHPATQPDSGGYTLNEWEDAIAQTIAPTICGSTSYSELLSDEMVYEILARFQGLRILENLWLERQLEKSDFLSVDGDLTPNEVIESFQCLTSRKEEFRYESITAQKSKAVEYAKFNGDQRARFYSATICVWLLQEIQWVFTNFAYPVYFGVQIELLEKYKEHISKQEKTPLLDDLDRSAVYMFMYLHLLPAYGTFLADQNSSKLPFTYSSDFSQDSNHSARLLQVFLTAGQTHLQPPDLIDLVVRSRISRRPPYPDMTPPKLTTIWQRPCSTLAFASNLILCDDGFKRLFQQHSLSHLSLIARSSFHQETQTMIRNDIGAPAPGETLFPLPDYAKRYFADRAIVAFELYEYRNGECSDIREVFPKMWDGVLWKVWWWANSEEKARAKMELWRHYTGTS